MFFIFSVLTVILSWYLINSRYQNYIPLSFFWIPVICILLVVAYQIINLEESSSQHLLILFEILAFSLIMRTIFVPGVAFYGYDPYHEYLCAIEISRNGWILSMSNPGLSYNIHYPILHFLAIILSEISGMTLLNVARWLPIIISIPSTLILYLLARKIFNSERVGLLTALGFSMLYQSQMFYSLYVRESIAFIMFVATIYLYYMAIHSRRVKYVPLAIISSFVSVFSHHLTPFLLVVFFALAYFSQKLVEKMQGYESSKLRKIAGLFSAESIYFHATFVLFLVVSLLNYWLYLRYTPFTIIATIFSEAYFISGGKTALIPASLRYWFILGGEIVFVFIFGLLSLYSIYFRRNKRTSLDLTFLAWVILMGMFSIGFVLGRIYPEGSFAVARRFQPFAYPFLFMLSGYVAHQKLKKTGLEKKLGMLLVFIFVLFSVFQLYSAPMYLYSDYRGSDEVRNILLPEEYNSILWLNTSRGVGTDWDIFAHAIFGLEGTFPYYSVEVFKGDTARYKYLIMRDVGPYSITEEAKEASLKFDNSTWISEIYNNGVVKVYKIQG